MGFKNALISSLQFFIFGVTAVVNQQPVPPHAIAKTCSPYPGGISLTHTHVFLFAFSPPPPTQPMSFFESKLCRWP